MRSCETSTYNKPIEENGWYENECSYEDHPGIQSNSVLLRGCSDWTAGRIDRTDDQNVYQPRIHSDRIRELYMIGEETGIPLTVLLDRAIVEYVRSYADVSGKEKTKQHT